MGKREGIQIVVVVEDQRLERFVRRALHAFGFDRNKVRVLQDYPKRGSGSGKQYVEETYKKEIVTFRRKSRENRALLLGTEADEQTVMARTQSLDAFISPPRDAQERILYWIPKWHVETWGLHLTGTTVDEDTNYHRQGGNIDWKLAGETFKAEYDRSKREPVETLDSLKTAYIETQRLGQ